VVEVWAFDEHRVGFKPIVGWVWVPIGERPLALVNHRVCVVVRLRLCAALDWTDRMVDSAQGEYRLVQRRPTRNLLGHLHCCRISIIFAIASSSFSGLS
jgi:hypothetical protein